MAPEARPAVSPSVDRGQNRRQNGRGRGGTGVAAGRERQGKQGQQFNNADKHRHAIKWIRRQGVTVRQDRPVVHQPIRVRSVVIIN